jgi:putative ABC transport system ATP-binding protein
MNQPAPPPPLIVLRDVVKRYATASGAFTALHDIDLEIEQGEFVAVVGKSGSGKSTLMNVIAGIDDVSAGEVLVNGTPVHTLTQTELARWRGRQVGVIFQFFQLLPTLTVAENVMLPMDFCDSYPVRERRARACALLAKLGIGDQADKLPSSLSGGQQQRAAIARALANDPALLVADEPTGNLDSETSVAIMELFAQLVAEGKTVLMVTHERDFSRYFTRQITLIDGAIADPPSTVTPAASTHRPAATAAMVPAPAAAMVSSASTTAAAATAPTVSPFSAAAATTATASATSANLSGMRHHA